MHLLGILGKFVRVDVVGVSGKKLLVLCLRLHSIWAPFHAHVVGFFKFGKIYVKVSMKIRIAASLSHIVRIVVIFVRQRPKKR